MNEYFLHFIWEHQYFHKHALQNSQGESLTVLHPGYHNTDQGPDFSHARLLMQQIEWHGNIEIHLKASDWHLHKHEGDKNYDTILLHVVWENDCQIKREDETIIPVLELKDRVDLTFLDTYKNFINSGIQLPCQYYLQEIEPVYVNEMFVRALDERLERKGKEVLQLYEKNQHDWEETFWQVFVSNFGFKINNEAFSMLGRTLPFKILLKHSNNQQQLEALLFGQSGLLDKAKDDPYVHALKKEYDFLSHKYSLREAKMSSHLWKFLRTRPYNFPTIRLAQLAALLRQCDMLINIIYKKNDPKEYVNFLQASVSAYWHKHYHFGEKMKGEVPNFAETAVYNIILNVVIPFKIARYLAGISEQYPEEVYALLRKIPSETNKLTKQWRAAGIPLQNAFDSQAGIELYNQYCLKRKCLYCSIGNRIIKK